MKNQEREYKYYFLYVDRKVVGACKTKRGILRDYTIPFLKSLKEDYEKIYGKVKINEISDVEFNVWEKARKV